MDKKSIQRPDTPKYRSISELFEDDPPLKIEFRRPPPVVQPKHQHTLSSFEESQALALRAGFQAQGAPGSHSRNRSNFSSHSTNEPEQRQFTNPSATYSQNEPQQMRWTGTGGNSIQGRGYVRSEEGSIAPSHSAGHQRGQSMQMVHVRTQSSYSNMGSGQPTGHRRGPPAQIQLPEPPNPTSSRPRRPTNENGVPYPDVNCSVQIMLVPKDAVLGNIFGLLGECGRIRSVEFTTGSTTSTKTALVVFTEVQGARNLLNHFATQGLSLGPHELRGLPGLTHIYSSPALTPDQSRILLVSGYGDAVLLPPMLEFLRRNVANFDLLHVAISPYTVPGGLSVWEMHFASIDQQATKCKEALKADKYYGKVLWVTYGTDPCEIASSGSVGQ